MPKFNVYRTSTVCVEIEADNEDDALEIAYNTDFEPNTNPEAIETEYGWHTEEV